MNQLVSHVFRFSERFISCRGRTRTADIVGLFTDLFYQLNYTAYHHLLPTDESCLTDSNISCPFLSRHVGTVVKHYGVSGHHLSIFFSSVPQHRKMPVFPTLAIASNTIIATNVAPVCGCWNTQPPSPVLLCAKMSKNALVPYVAIVLQLFLRKVKDSNLRC